MPLLSPQIVDARHPFPFLNNKDIYYIAQLFHKGEGVSFGIVPVSDRFERVMFIKDGDATCFAFIEELVAHYAATIFNASTVQKQCLFRVTRNADITVDEGMMDHDIDFRDVMSELLKKRRKLAAVRLQFWPEAPQEIVKFLREKLVVPSSRCYTQTSPLDSASLFKLAGRIAGDGSHAEMFYPAPNRCRPRPVRPLHRGAQARCAAGLPLPEHPAVYPHACSAPGRTRTSFPSR